MAENNPKEHWGQGVEVSSPKLVDLAFRFEGEDLPDPPFNITYSIALHRFTALRLGVQFGAEIVDIPDFTARAVYRMIFTLKPESPEAADPEHAFGIIIARMAPVAMYPFIREALASISQKALLPALILPVQNVGSLWKVGELELPAPPEDSSAHTPAEQE